MSDNHMENSQSGSSTNVVWQIVGRLITAGVVLEITAFFTSDNGEELIRNVCAEKNIISLDCRKAEWSDRALYPAKRIIL